MSDDNNHADRILHGTILLGVGVFVGMIVALAGALAYLFVEILSGIIGTTMVEASIATGIGLCGLIVLVYLVGYVDEWWKQRGGGR